VPGPAAKPAVTVVDVGFLVAIVPSIGVLFIFWLAIRAMVQADRREREAHARFDAQLREGAGSADPAGTPSASTAVTDKPSGAGSGG